MQDQRSPRSTWCALADQTQESLDHYFSAPGLQYLNNTFPPDPDDNQKTFNYWWLAHVIDVRLDAYERSGDQRWIDKAEETRQNLVSRNSGSLFNDYFDDMLWFALALVHLHDLTDDETALSDASRIWSHVCEYGLNDALGTSVSWRKQQPRYKNTPANAPFVMLSAQLHMRGGSARQRQLAEDVFHWLTDTLVGDDGFVEDGINRLGDGRIDTQWRFTYNQGVYVAAATALAEMTGDTAFLEMGERTALTAIHELSRNGVFLPEGQGGDEGLFKGIYYRYAIRLLEESGVALRTVDEISQFIRSSTDSLVANAHDGNHLLAGNDWAAPPTATVYYSTQLSAMMAVEARARLEAK